MTKQRHREIEQLIQGPSQGVPELGFEPRTTETEILASFQEEILSVCSCWDISVPVKRKKEVKRGGMSVQLQLAVTFSLPQRKGKCSDQQAARQGWGRVERHEK